MALVSERHAATSDPFADTKTNATATIPMISMNKAPICPQCDVQMVERGGRKIEGRYLRKFYGCPNWPQCDETATHEDDDFAD